MSYAKYFKVVIITIFDDCIIFKYMDGHLLFGLPWWLRWRKNLPTMQETQFNPWIGKIPWRREYLPIPVFLPGDSLAQRNLVGYSPFGHRESDMTEQHLLFGEHLKFK